MSYFKVLFSAIALTLLVSCGGGSSTPQTPAATPPAAAATPSAGEKVYITYCVACHAKNGKGIENMYPPLAGSRRVNGPAAPMLAVIFNGLQGEEIDGVKYSMAMTPYRDILSDEQIRDVTNYVRTAWGNSGSSVSMEDVATARAKKPGA